MKDSKKKVGSREREPPLGSEAWGFWWYLLFRMRFVQGGGGRGGAQTNRVGTGIALEMGVLGGQLVA